MVEVINCAVNYFFEITSIAPKNIIELSQKQAYQAINTALVYRNWLIGYRIAEEELKGEDRAGYGTTLIRKLSKELTNEYGKVIQKLIFIVFILSIKCIQTFSTRRVENLCHC